MDITVYVPDSLGRRYKDARASDRIPRGTLSRIVRECLERELERVAAEDQREYVAGHAH